MSLHKHTFAIDVCLTVCACVHAHDTQRIRTYVHTVPATTGLTHREEVGSLIPLKPAALEAECLQPLGCVGASVHWVGL